MKENKNPIRRTISGIKTLFLNGLFTILPIAVTFFILHWTYTTLARWLYPLRVMEPQILQKIPGSEFIIITLIIIFFGILLKIFIVAPLIHYFERIIAKIPIINSIYSAAKTLVDFFNVPDPSSIERKVVLIRYPNQKFYNIAFLLGSAKESFQNLIPPDKRVEGEEYVKIFMPNSPNPSSGYFFILPKSETIETNISFEEAIKTVVSCGLITPESIKGIQAKELWGEWPE